jgi:uncharacterized protein YegP (UPF0339 family)
MALRPCGRTARRTRDSSARPRRTGTVYFVLTATNGEVIGKSQMYSSAATLENGIASVKKNAADAKVIDRTGE